MSNTPAILDKLAAPFDADEVKWKPQAVKGDRAMAIAYIDARVVMDRLDEVLGIEGWEDRYDTLPDGQVRCSLTVHLGERSVTKCDVGGESDQPDDGDKAKAAHSDALKRAAVKFGIGRYLYRLPHQWVDFDAQRKCLKAKPSLPAWAIPPKPITPDTLAAVQKGLTHCKMDWLTFQAALGLKAGIYTRDVKALTEHEGQQSVTLLRDHYAATNKKAA